MANEPLWMQYAREDIDLNEVRDSEKIIAMAADLGSFIKGYFTNAHTIPWCGIFVAANLRKAGIRTNGDRSMSALSWQFWGQHMAKGAPGAVIVFTRPGTGAGHVGFYVGEDASCYYVLGGNQSDSVCVERILKTRCVAIRWPSESAAISSPVTMARGTTKVSSNEQ